MDDVFGGKALSHPKKVLQVLQDPVQVWPATVHIGPMAGCNHDCVWCSDLEYRRKYPGYLPLKEFVPVLHEFAAVGVMSVVWIGSGEPTYHPQFSQLVDAAAEAGLVQGCVTNGSRFPVDKIQLFEWVRVSLDAGRPETHKKLHVVSDHDRVMGNLQQMAANKGDTVVGVSYLLCEDNAAELPALVQTLDEWGVDYIQIKRLASTQRYTALPVDLETGFETKQLQVIDDVAATKGGNAGLPCWASSMNTVIAPTGDVMLCCRLSNTGRDEEAKLGNIFEMGSFSAVWTGERRAEVVRRFQDPKVTRSCPTCWMTQFNVQIDRLQKNKVARKSLLFV